MKIIARYKNFICVVESMKNLYKDSNGIWRDKTKASNQLVGTYINEQEREVQLSLF